MEIIEIDSNKYEMSILGDGTYKFKLLDTEVEHLIEARKYKEQIKKQFPKISIVKSGTAFSIYIFMLGSNKPIILKDLFN